MSKAVFLFQSLDSYAVKEALPNVEISIVHTKARCADYLIDNPDVDAVFVQRDALGPEHRRFIEALKKHFPLIVTGFIGATRPDPLLEDCVLIVRTRSPEIIGREIGVILADSSRREKRASVRYDWPLRGRLIPVAGGTPDGLPCRIRSLSAGGAFLESDAPGLKQKEVCSIGIEFLNQRCRVEAEVVSLRPASSSAKAGCGVRFLKLPQAALDLFDRVVRDALMQALLSPEEEVKPPVLDDDSLSIPGFQAV